MVRNAPRIWALSDGRAGMRSQALGLAEAVGRLMPAEVEDRVIEVREPWRSLPRAVWGDPFARLSADTPLAPPWPEVLIACGRVTIPYSLALADECLTVQTQDPRVAPGRFGLVVPPAHDRLDGPNVFPILGSPNLLTEGGLARDARSLEALLPALPRPLSAFLIGGPSADHRMTPAALSGIADVMEEAARLGHGLLVTFSRRTPEGAMTYLLEALEELPARSQSWIWDGRDLPGLGNPYLGILGLADRFFVTEESANMLSEAGYTGRPVHALPLQGGAAKWRRFHDQLTRHGVLNPEAGLDDVWTYEPLRETDRAAEAVLAVWSERRGHERRGKARG